MNTSDMAVALYGEATAVQPIATPRPAAGVEAPEHGMPAGPTLTPTTHAQAANTLYGEPISAKAAAVENAEEGSAPPSKQEESSHIKIDVPDHVKAERESDQGRKLYSAQAQFKSALPDNLFDPQEIEGEDAAAPISPEVRKAVVSELRDMAADLGLEPLEVKEFQQRSALLRTSPVPVSQQVQDSIDALNAAFGKDASKCLKDARALIAKDPRTAQIVDALGLGNDSRTILTLAHAARRARAAGKLK
jgi:hypothetical protein